MGDMAFLNRGVDLQGGPDHASKTGLTVAFSSFGSEVYHLATSQHPTLELYVSLRC